MSDKDRNRNEETGTRQQAAACPDPNTLALLVEGALKDHRGFKSIMSLLYDEGMAQRLMAARALGEVARRDPEMMKQRWERIFRAFDDTMSCWGAAEALGEIGRNLPGQRSKIALFLRGFRRDECSCQGYIWAMCRICQVDGKMTGDFIPDLTGFLDSENVCMVGQAIWAVGELEIRDAAEKLKGFLDDGRETWILENESACIKSIGRISEEALKKMKSNHPS